MKVFRLDSDDLFVTEHPTFVNILRVFKVELQEPVISLRYSDNANYIAELKENDALEVFDHTIKGPMMISLTKWLNENPILLINRQGNIYWNGNHDQWNLFFRLNVMFNWSFYGVRLSNIANNVQNRLYLETNEVVVASKDKLLEEYEQKNKEREKELIDCKQKLQEVESKLSASQKDLEEKEKENFTLKERIEELLSLLDEKEKKFTGLDVRYVEMEKQFEVTKKQLWQTENMLEGKEKALANLQICFAEKEAKFKLMEKHLSYMEKTLEEKSEDLRKTKKHLARTEKILEENNEDLRKTKLELEAKGRVIEVWTILWERQLGISRLPPMNQGEEDCSDQMQVRVTFEEEGSGREEEGITRSDP